MYKIAGSAVLFTSVLEDDLTSEYASVFILLKLLQDIKNIYVAL